MAYIEKYSDTSYRVTVSCGYDTNGKQVRRKKTTFSEFAQEWMTVYTGKKLAPKTVTRYKSLLIRINQALGGIKL